MRHLQSYVLKRDEMELALRLLLVAKGLHPPEDMKVLRVDSPIERGGGIVALVEGESFPLCAEGCPAMNATLDTLLAEQYAKQRIE